jgi:CBS domain containing-hemolysin-like protein
LDDGSPKSGVLARLLRPFRKFSPSRFEEEISDLIDHGAESGAIPKSSGEMIQSIFDFSDTVVRKIMTPRIKVVGVDACATIEEAVTLVREQGWSRLPVYRGDLDHVVGFLMAKDLLGYWGAEGSTPLPSELVRPVIMVHGNRLIGELLDELMKKKSHLAVVLDEYGGTAGLVTLEDIIEEIVGDIHDEYDQEETEDIREIGPGLFLASGRSAVSDLNDVLPKPLPEGDYDTLGGFLTGQLGRVPDQGETVSYEDYSFHIKAADSRKVEEVEIRLPDSAGQPPAGEGAAESLGEGEGV